jgi:hypothetical protein
LPQAVFAGKLNDPLSCSEKVASSGRHNRANLLLLRGLKGALQSSCVIFGLNLLQL